MVAHFESHIGVSAIAAFLASELPRLSLARNTTAPWVLAAVCYSLQLPAAPEGFDSLQSADVVTQNKSLKAIRHAAVVATLRM